MLPHLRAGRLRWSVITVASVRRFLSERRVERFSRVARARGSAKTRRHGSSSDRERHALAALAREPEQHHDSRLAIAHAELVQPDICIFDLDPSDTETLEHCAARLELARFVD
jgi:hypothetical protein